MARRSDKGITWANVEPYGKAFWSRPGPAGKTGIWAIPVEAASDEIYSNKKLFKELIRTLSLAIQLLVSDQYQDVGMLAMGLLIRDPVRPVEGMTAGAIRG